MGIRWKVPLPVAAALGAGLLTVGGVAAAVLTHPGSAAAASGSGSSGGTTATAPVGPGGAGPGGPGGFGGPGGHGPWGPGGVGGPGGPGGPQAWGPGGARGPRGAHAFGRGVGGTVQSVAADGSSFTVLGRNQQTYTVSVSSSTTYSYGPGLSATASDVKQGERVMVVGTISGTDVTAKAVHIGAAMERGQVVAVSGSQVTVQAPDGRQAIVDISGVSSPPAVTQGQQVAAAGSWTSSDTSGIADTLDAQAFAVVPDHLAGVVGTVNGDSATVQTRSGKTVTLQWTSQTTITSGPRGSTSTATVASGDRVLAVGQSSGSTFNATHIFVLPAPPTPPQGSSSTPPSN